MKVLPLNTKEAHKYARSKLTGMESRTQIFVGVREYLSVKC